MLYLSGCQIKKKSFDKIFVTIDELQFFCYIYISYYLQ